jgi:DNA-directed RNA polymerase subunit RPC12/RpoP
MTLNPDNHHAIETRVTANATCTDDGSILKYCPYCNYMETIIIPKYHDWAIVEIVAPACESEGYTIYVCNACGITENRDFVNALPHDHTKVIEIVLPVCGTDGYIRYGCNRAGCTSTVVEAIKYVFNNPDHHGDHGKPAPVCNNPDHKNYSGVDVKPGDGECDCTGTSIITSPTENKVGLQQYECEHCGARYYVVLPALSDKKD